LDGINVKENEHAFFVVEMKVDSEKTISVISDQRMTPDISIQGKAIKST